jgi:hypothetical protein
MADESGLSPFVFACQGGLVLDQSTFIMQPGTALELENFEPDVQGGYRRISGYAKWISGEVPYTASTTEPVLMSAYFGDNLLAARGEKVFKSTNATTLLDGAILVGDTTLTVDSTVGFPTTGTLLIGTEQITYTGKTATTFTGCTRGANGTVAAGYVDNTPVSAFWTEIDTGRTNALKYTFFRYNLAGTSYIVWADGANNASKYDGTTVTDLNATGAPADPKFVTGFKNTLFFAGMSNNPEEVIFTAPYTDDDFSVANGAGSIAVDSPVTAIVPFREQLYIFCEERIFRLSGNSAADFTLQPVSREIGCLNGFTIQEFAGDLVYLGPDGLRTVAGTDRIGDVELGTISRQIQERFTGLTDVDEFDSLVIPDKTQYRLFFSDSSKARNLTRGIICVRKGDTYEFGDLKGIAPSCTDYTIAQGESFIFHGGFDGYVYRQEQGIDFDGNTVTGKYRSPDLTMGDAGIRKTFQRVILNYAPESIVNADLLVRYDYESPNVPRPAAYPFDTTTAVAIYGSSIFGIATYGGQTNPLVRQPIEGSGFAIALRVNDRGASAPYSLKGFQLEFEAAARR